MPAAATTSPVAEWLPAASADDKALREELMLLWGQLDAEYMTSWYGTQRDIIDFMQPGRGAFWLVDTNRGFREDVRVVNSTAEDCLQKLGAAMDTGITSEAREWFIVGPEDPIDAEDRGVREHCHQYQAALQAFISKAGFYAPNRNALEDCCGPATGAVIIEEDAKNGARCTHIPVGQYRCAADSTGEVNVLTRRFLYTAAQMVQEFGAEKCSQGVRSAISNNMGQVAKFTVLHVIKERLERDPDRIDAMNMPWASYWLEVGQGYATSAAVGTQVNDPVGPSGLLRQSGYNECPFYVYRWNQIGQDAYGKGSPGWKGLSDTRALQDLELGEATVQATIMNPPMNEPSSLKNGSILPGARNPLPDDTKVKYEPSVVIPPLAVEVAEKVIQRTELRLNRTMYGDILFLLSGDRSAQKDTAEAVRGKQQERLLQLGGVFARVSRELRKALIRLASLAHRAGKLPKPPLDLLQRKMALKIDFTNPLIAAQKAVGAQALKELVSFGLASAQAKQGGFDNYDARKGTNIFADMMGVAPDVLFSDEEMAQKDQAAAQAANAKAQTESLPQAAGAINDLSNSDPDKLEQVLSRFSPQAVAQGTAGLPN